MFKQSMVLSRLVALESKLQRAMVGREVRGTRDQIWLKLDVSTKRKLCAPVVCARDASLAGAACARDGAARECHDL